MRGGTLKKLVIYTDMVAPSNGVRTQHDIRMTEVQLQRIMGNQRNRKSCLNWKQCIIKCVCVCVLQHKWKYFNSVSEKAVSHADFLSVLSDIQYVIIKASYGTRLQQSRYYTLYYTLYTLYYTLYTLYYTHPFHSTLYFSIVIATVTSAALLMSFPVCVVF